MQNVDGLPFLWFFLWWFLLFSTQISGKLFSFHYSLSPFFEFECFRSFPLVKYFSWKQAKINVYVKGCYFFFSIALAIWKYTHHYLALIIPLCPPPKSQLSDALPEPTECHSHARGWGYLNSVQWTPFLLMWHSWFQKLKQNPICDNKNVWIARTVFVLCFLGERRTNSSPDQYRQCNVASGSLTSQNPFVMHLWNFLCQPIAVRLYSFLSISHTYLSCTFGQYTPYPPLISLVKANGSRLEMYIVMVPIPVYIFSSSFFICHSVNKETCNALVIQK